MRLQVAEVIAACVANPDLSANKTIEVVASDVAPPRPLEEMLEDQPVEITVEELRERQVRPETRKNQKEPTKTHAYHITRAFLAIIF